MDKPTFKLIGQPCGQHGQYTFYKALRLCGEKEKIIAIGDFFFVRLWQDSELVSIGELQLLWTDRVSDQTLVSLRLYFLPENTPDGRNQHGEDEVLAINDKVVIRAEDLLSWVCPGVEWRWGLRAVWRGACAPPSEPANTTALHHTKLDFSDVDKEKNAMVADSDSPGVVVFSYPRYCRYRALVARLEGIHAAWLRDSLVCALGGYAAPTTNTRILYCKDTFEYPELEGHEFVCNHLAPKLKGRPRGRRRRRARSREQSRSSDSDSDRREEVVTAQTPRRLSLRNGPDSEDETKKSEDIKDIKQEQEDEEFLQELRQFYKDRNEPIEIDAEDIKDLSLRGLYDAVCGMGGWGALCGRRAWRALAPHPARAAAAYHRYLLPFENHNRMKTPKQNGKIDEIHEIVEKEEKNDEKDFDITTKPAEILNREFLESLPPKEKPLITVKPVEKLLDLNKVTDYFKNSDVVKIFNDNKVIVDELTDKYKVKDSAVLSELVKCQLSDDSTAFLNELAVKLNIGTSEVPLPDGAKPPESVLSSLSALGDKYVNGHTHTIPNNEQKNSRPVGRSLLRAVRVKPARPHSNLTASLPPLRSDSSSTSPPAATLATTLTTTYATTLTTTSATTLTTAVTTTTTINNFGIHRPPPPTVVAPPNATQSDDEIVEVPYKPKTPEIIDLDEYPESPQSVKKKKLDILKERGLEVTPIPTSNWPPQVIPNPITPLINPSPIILNPAVQHQIMTQAQLYQMYNIIPPIVNGTQPPKVVQSSSVFGNSGYQKTVYGNPKDAYMPAPHFLHGMPIKPQKPQSPSAKDILDLTCKMEGKPAVEIVRVPNTTSPKSTAQNLTKNYTLMDGKAVVGSNLEITLVSPKVTPTKNRPPQKRSSNGKFMSTKTPTPPKEYPKSYASPSPSNVLKKPPITVPAYQIRDDASPTSSTGSRDSQNNIPNLLNNYKGQNLAQMMEMQKAQVPYIDPYIALQYSLGQMDPRQLAIYREFMNNQFRNYGVLNMGAVTPTTKN